MWIDDNLKNRVLEKSIAGELPIIGDECIKCKACSWNELAAYQLATFLHLRVPKVRCFIAKRSLQFDGENRPKGSLVMLMENMGNTGFFHPVLSAPCDHVLKARFLSFFVFDRDHEWPNICWNGSTLYLLDLESQFARFPSDESNISQELDAYAGQTKSAFNSCERAAIEGGFANEFMNAGKDMIKLIEYGFVLNFGTSVAASRVTQFLRDSIKIRIEVLKEVMA